MHICLNLDPSRLLRWHWWLAQALAANPDNRVSRAFTLKRHPLPSYSHLLLQLERLIYGSRGQAATESLADAMLALPLLRAEPIDVTIDLGGEGSPPAARRVLTPYFNGVPGEIGVMAALTSDQDLVVELHDTAHPSRSWVAHPASEDRGVFAASLDAALSCATALIVKALSGEADRLDVISLPSAKLTTISFGTASALAFATGAFAAKATRMLNKIAKGGEAWAIGWRLDRSASLLDRHNTTFRVLTGGPSGYLADPFPFRRNGQDFIFVEQYLYAKDRGCIAVVTLDRNGIASAPQIVLEEPHHLSYPFVFEHAGEIWMIPESGTARNVSLYRAIEFPYRWKHEACLIETIEAYDVTPLQHSGGFWFFVSPRLWQSSSWDILDLYHADSLTGPWSAQAASPTLIDARLSRSGGAIIERGGRLIRPAQDCSRGYGGAVTFCRIDTLGAQGFAQTPIGRIDAGSFGCHTYNRQAGLEVIDIFGQVRGLRDATISYVALASDTRISELLDQYPAPARREVTAAAHS
jgi:hypothetical protein